jgi:hypothetical protein
VCPAHGFSLRQRALFALGWCLLLCFEPNRVTSPRCLLTLTSTAACGLACGRHYGFLGPSPQPETLFGMRLALCETSRWFRMLMNCALPEGLQQGHFHCMPFHIRHKFHHQGRRPVWGPSRRLLIIPPLHGAVHAVGRTAFAGCRPANTPATANFGVNYLLTRTPAGTIYFIAGTQRRTSTLLRLATR